MATYMQKSRWLVLLLLGVFALVLLAACGGTDGDDGASGIGRSDGEIRTSDNVAIPGTYGVEEGAGTDGTTGGNNAALPSLLDRKIIQTATLTVTLDDVSAGFQDVTNIALGAGGFIASSSFGNTGERQKASLTVRVPAAAYNDTLSRLRGLGDVRDVNTGANDVTEQFTDLESRLRNLQATEQRYVDLLANANTIDEILTVQDRINATRLEIEQVQGRINMFANQADLATITVHLAPPVAGASAGGEGGLSNPVEVAERAFEASLSVLTGMAVVAVAVLAFSWWLIPVAAVALYIFRKQSRGGRARQDNPPVA